MCFKSYSLIILFSYFYRQKITGFKNKGLWYMQDCNRKFFLPIPATLNSENEILTQI